MEEVPPSCLLVSFARRLHRCLRRLPSPPEARNPTPRSRALARSLAASWRAPPRRSRVWSPARPSALTRCWSAPTKRAPWASTLASLVTRRRRSRVGLHRRQRLRRAPRQQGRAPLDAATAFLPARSSSAACRRAQGWASRPRIWRTSSPASLMRGRINQSSQGEARRHYR